MVDVAKLVIAGKEFEIVDFRPKSIILKYVGPIEDPDGFKFDVRYYLPTFKVFNLKNVVDVRPGSECSGVPGAFLIDCLKWQ